MFYAPFPQITTDTGKHIVVDLNILAFGAYKDGKLVKWGISNGGKGICDETGEYKCKTPVGTWKVYEIKRGFQRSDLYPVNCKNKKVCGHPYFNVVKFGKNYEALHGERPGHIPGVNISHGCVRLTLADSVWLVNNFVELGTKIIVRPYK